MYCSKCGMQNDSNNIFCQNCGEVLNKNSSMSMEENDANIHHRPQQETNYQPNEVKIENQNTFNTQTSRVNIHLIIILMKIILKKLGLFH